MSRPSKTALIGLVTVVVVLCLFYFRARFAVPKFEPVWSCVANCNQSSASNRLPAPSVLPKVSSTKPIKEIYSVEELSANPQNFAHTIVSASGCFETGFEITVLKPCGGPSVSTFSQMIWLEDAGILEDWKWLRQKGILRKFYGDESYASWERQLLFTYNARRDRQAWKKLPKGYGIDGTPVVLLGQFETSGDHPCFGHLGAYSNELIFVDVLDNKSTTK